VTDAGTRRLVVVRHGETFDNAAGIWQGHRDSPLSPVGREQARRAAPVLAAYRPQVIVSSDLERARDTAAAVGEACGMPVRLDPRLREVDVGEWQGLTNVEVRERDPHLLAAMGRGEDVRRGTTGETVAELTLRVRAALDDVVSGLGPAAVAVVVCHGVSARAGVASLVGLDQMQAQEVLWGLENAHWAVLAQTGLVAGAPVSDRWRIDAWNVGAQPSCAAAVG
jgi:glucosyl-3-phosphoglycerate phosphatase